MAGSWSSTTAVEATEAGERDSAVGATALGCMGCHKQSTLCTRSGTWTSPRHPPSPATIASEPP